MSQDRGKDKGKGGGARRGGRGADRGGQRGGQRRRDGNDRVEELSKPLQKVLARLPATQREVLEWRMGLKDGHPHDLADTARAMGLSMSEARDIERRAFEHIREVVPLQHLQRLLQG